MPHPSRNVVLLPLATRTASDVSADIIIPEQYTAAIVKLTVGTITGTSPTLNVYVQDKVPTPGAADTVGGFPSGAPTYADFISFTQVTTAAKTYIVRVVGGGNVMYEATDGTLAAGTVRNGPIGREWRIKWTIAGSTPTYPFSLVATLIP